MAKFCVIVPAAGKAERFGGEEKKTFTKLDGRPIFIRSLEQFVNREDVCQTILAVAREDVIQMKSTYGVNLGFMRVTLVEGGARRRDTVAAALKAVSDQADYIAVHDAVRPCVTSEQVDAVFAEAQKSGAAILAAPLSGTIKRVGQTRIIEETISRTGLFEAQTPQVFRKNFLLEAYARCEGTDDEITDDSQVVERAGHSVSVVVSDMMNLKITTRADMLLAGAILKVRPTKRVSRLGAFEEAQW